jgi:hypothetical protein
MIALYYFLARDEERRMLNQFGDRYRQYMSRTGMFLPQGLEQAADRLPFPHSGVLRPLLGFVLLVALAIGGAFALRAYTVAQLPLLSQGRITALRILPGDSVMLEHRMTALVELPAIRSRLQGISGPLLVYVIPQQYVMQGMIADTGPQWRLYEHHQTLEMIADWIFHPFRHLQGGHMMMHHDGAGTPPKITAHSGAIRRLIFLSIDAKRSSNTPELIFGINTSRKPQFYVDVDMHTLALLDIHSLGPGTGWGRVPTPMF